MTGPASWRLVALAFSLLPGALAALMLLRLSRGRMSLHLLGVSVAGGALIAAVPGLLTTAANVALRPRLGFLLGPAWTAFVSAGVSEEASKLVVAYFIVRPFYERRTAADLALGTAAVSLGFALIENVSYVLRGEDTWQWIAMSRAMTAVPIHVLLGLGLGLGLAHAERAARPWAKIAGAYALAALLHGFYDFPLMLVSKTPIFDLRFIQAAAFFHLRAWTFAVVILLIAVIAICLRGAYAAGVADRLAGDMRVDPAHLPAMPRLVRRLAMSPWSGLVFGGSIGLLALGLLAADAQALAAQAIPVIGMFLGSIVAIFATFAWCFGLKPGARPREAIADAQRAAQDLLATRKLAAAVAACAAGAAILGAGYLLPGAYSLLVSGILIASGNMYVSTVDLNSGMQNFTDAIAWRPDLVPPYLARARLYHQRQEFGRAIEDLDQAVRLRPGDSNLLATRAELYSADSQQARALEDYDRALAIKPDNASALVERSALLAQTGKIREALADLDRAKELRPDLVTIHSARAEIYELERDFDRARDELNVTLRLKPDDASAYFHRGRIAYIKGDFKAAIPDLVRAVESRGLGAYPILWLYLARTHAGMDGRRELAFWSRLTPQDIWPSALVAFYLDPRRRLGFVFPSAKTPGQNCEANFYMAEYLRAVKQPRVALPLMQRAAATCPKGYIEYMPAVESARDLAAQVAHLPPPRLAPPPQAPAPSWRLPSGDPAPPTRAARKNVRFYYQGKAVSGAATWRALRLRPDDPPRSALEIRIEAPVIGTSTLTIESSPTPVPGAEAVFRFQ